MPLEPFDRMSLRAHLDQTGAAQATVGDER